MLISADHRMSNIASCIEAAPQFLLSQEEATDIAETQKLTIEENWQHVCDEASLNQVDRNLLWGRQFLNPYSFGK